MVIVLNLTLTVLALGALIAGMLIAFRLKPASGPEGGPRRWARPRSPTMSPTAA
jgi:hypothetical protein